MKPILGDAILLCGLLGFEPGCEVSREGEAQAASRPGAVRGASDAGPTCPGASNVFAGRFARAGRDAGAGEQNPADEGEESDEDENAARRRGDRYLLDDAFLAPKAGDGCVVLDFQRVSGCAVLFDGEPLVVDCPDGGHAEAPVVVRQGVNTLSISLRAAPGSFLDAKVNTGEADAGPPDAGFSDAGR